MGVKRQARECALQILYMVDAMGSPTGAVDDAVVSQAIRHFFDNFDAPDRSTELATTLVRRIAGDRPALDERIARHSPHWRIERMSLVDRNLLRLCTHLLLHDRDESGAQ